MPNVLNSEMTKKMLCVSLKKLMAKKPIKLLAEHEGILIWQDGLLQLFNYLEENKAVCLCTLNSMGHQHLKRLL